MSQATKLVCLKPYNKNKGHLARSFTHRGKKYANKGGKRVWHEVPTWIAKELSEYTQPNSDAPLFDVKSTAEAKRIDHREKIEESSAEAPKKVTGFRGESGPAPEQPAEPAPAMVDPTELFDDEADPTEEDEAEQAKPAKKTSNRRSRKKTSRRNSKNTSNE